MLTNPSKLAPVKQKLPAAVLLLGVICFSPVFAQNAAVNKQVAADESRLVEIF
jgi:hypothetical protein